MSYQWKAGEGIADGFRRIAGEELDSAVDGLAHPEVRGVEATVHDVRKRCKKVRGLAESGDEMCRAIFQVQAHALGLFFDIMINTFDPDALIVGGGAIETGPDFQQWFVSEIRAGMPNQRDEQASIPIHIMPHGDTAGARGAAIEALNHARHAGLL